MSTYRSLIPLLQTGMKVKAQGRRTNADFANGSEGTLQGWDGIQMILVEYGPTKQTEWVRFDQLCYYVHSDPANGEWLTAWDWVTKHG